MRTLSCLARVLRRLPCQSQRNTMRIGPPPLCNAPCRARSKLFNPPLPINMPRRALLRPHNVPRSNHHRTLTTLVRRRRGYHLRYPDPAYQSRLLRPGGFTLQETQTLYSTSLSAGVAFTRSIAGSAATAKGEVERETHCSKSDGVEAGSYVPQ